MVRFGLVRFNHRRDGLGQVWFGRVRCGGVRFGVVRYPMVTHIIPNTNV